MGKFKVRKIGTSVGIILPKGIGVNAGDILPYHKQGNQLILDMNDLDKNHDRAIIEKGFEDFERGLIVTREEMKQTFGKYGWK